MKPQSKKITSGWRNRMGLPSGLLLLLLSVSLSANEAAPDSPAHAYPTLERVEFVLGCMDVRGGQNYTNMYGCVCLIDEIAAHLPYQAYLEATTLQVMMKTPGERGGAFRDAPGARKMTKTFDQVVADGQKKCFVN